MTKVMIRIHNAETNEIIDREMTPDELAQFKLDAAKAKQDIVEEELKLAKKAALLERLGITQDEAKLLIS